MGIYVKTIFANGQAEGKLIEGTDKEIVFIQPGIIYPLCRRRDLLRERRSRAGPDPLGGHHHVQGGEAGRHRHRHREEEEGGQGYHYDDGAAVALRPHILLSCVCNYRNILV